MIIRTYFDKNNTIVSNKTVNTGLNPVSELFYGGGPNRKIYSRFLFHFNEERIKKLYNDGTFADITKLKHTLNMTNTGCFDFDLLNTNLNSKMRTTSFDLIVFKINEEWDNGTGYDYELPIMVNGKSLYFNGSSNWYEAKKDIPWNASGTYDVIPLQIIGTPIHFDKGNENISFDITDYVNSVLTGGTQNYGLGLAFTRNFEISTSEEPQYVGFFTNNTQTFYEPFIETVYNNQIKDDRNDFYLDKTNKLYLYVNLGGIPTNLDELPIVEIIDNNNNIIDNPVVEHVSKGIYCIDLLVNTTLNNIETMYYDKWSNIKINGVNRPTIEMEFIVKDSMGYYQMSSDVLPKKIGLNISGLQNNEKIKRGDLRKVIVSARVPYTVNQNEKMTDIKYRLYVKEGSAEYTVIDYHPIEMSVNNYYFLLDTESLLPNKYYVDMLVTSNLEATTFKDVVNFTIINQVELK